MSYKDSMRMQNPSGKIKQVERRRRNALLEQEMGAEIADTAIKLHNSPVYDRYLKNCGPLTYSAGLASGSIDAQSSVLSVAPPDGIFIAPTPATVLHPFHDLINSYVGNDLQLLAGFALHGSEPKPDDYKCLQSDFVRDKLKEWGYDPDTALGLPEGKRIKIARKMLQELHRLTNERNKAQGGLNDLKQASADFESDIREVARRLELPFKLERPQGSSLHHMYDFVKAGKTIYSDELIKQGIDLNYQSFVIEHDWAAAFTGAQDFDHGGEFPLPYDHTCFEFRVNGMRILMLLGTYDGVIIGNLMTGINGRWYLNFDSFRFVGGKIMSAKPNSVIEPWANLAGAFLNKLADQIRAVCIMLDAQVAERELIRASERLNQQRVAKGKMPLRSYHVVSLARKHRAKPMEDHVATPGTRRRLHFRRGHWRHFADHRTWINWMLVGDPDLGFVDKHYKL